MARNRRNRASSAFCLCLAPRCALSRRRCAKMETTIASRRGRMRMCPRLNRVAAWTLILMASSLAGCYDAKEVNAFLLKPRTPVSGAEYRVLPPDILLITSQRIAEINNFQTVIRPDGRINLPLLGE